MKTLRQRDCVLTKGEAEVGSLAGWDPRAHGSGVGLLRPARGSGSGVRLCCSGPVPASGVRRSGVRRASGDCGRAW